VAVVDHLERLGVAVAGHRKQIGVGDRAHTGCVAAVRWTEPRHCLAAVYTPPLPDVSGRAARRKNVCKSAGLHESLEH